MTGARFESRWEARRHVPRLHPVRLARIALAAGLFTIGMLSVFVPGPGGSVFILGSAFVLSGESRTFARLLDWGERRFERQVRWVLDHPVVAVATITTIVTVGVALAGWAIAR